MSLDELADALFPSGGHALTTTAGVTSGTGTTQTGTVVAVIGISGGHPVGTDAAVAMSGLVLEHIARADRSPLLVLVDTQSQRMARREELLGLNEFLAHLCKSLALASLSGSRTVGILYGGAAAGAFLATALSTDVLVTVPGAEPSVMDLESIARVTKLPLAHLKDMAKTTPIFAPGPEHLAITGAVTETWDAAAGTYAARLDALLSAEHTTADTRDQLGADRHGRREAARITRLVMDEALAGH